MENGKKKQTNMQGIERKQKKTCGESYSPFPHILEY